MKAEINNENKAKFFALYYDQAALFTCSFVKGEDLNSILNRNDKIRYGQKGYLTLKDPLKISDYEALKISDIVGFPAWVNKHKIEEVRDWIRFDFKLTPIIITWDITHVFDYLRSKGYALPWMGLSVDEMIQAGWIKLTEQ